jgi:hypothetical protein
MLMSHKGEGGGSSTPDIDYKSILLCFLEILNSTAQNQEMLCIVEFILSQ